MSWLSSGSLSWSMEGVRARWLSGGGLLGDRRAGCLSGSVVVVAGGVVVVSGGVVVVGAVVGASWSEGLWWAATGRS